MGKTVAEDIESTAGRRASRSARAQGMDFSGQDLRGVDFTGADVRSSRFQGARLGVPPSRGVAFLGLAVLLAAGAGTAIGWAVQDTAARFVAGEVDQIAEGGVLTFVFVLVLGLLAWRGFDIAIRVAFAAYIALVAVGVVANLLLEEVEWVRLGSATVLLFFVVLAISAGILGRLIGGVFGSWSIAIVSVLGGLASGRAEGGVVGIVVALAMVFISKRAMRGDERDQTLRTIAHRLIRRWGTRFVDADLTGSDFTDTDPRGCDFRGAIVDDVIWEPMFPLPLYLTPPDAPQ